MALETLSPELAYATKGNIAYPTTAGIDGTQTAVGLAGLAQKRLADSASGSLSSAFATLTTAASGATTTLAIANGLQGVTGIPSGGLVNVLAANQVVTFTASAAAAPGATSITVTSLTPGITLPIGSYVVYGSTAASVGPGPQIAAQ